MKQIIDYFQNGSISDVVIGIIIGIMILAWAISEIREAFQKDEK